MGISAQIHNERICVVEYSEDIANYLYNLCLPAQIIGYAVQKNAEGEDVYSVICSEESLNSIYGKFYSNIETVARILGQKEVKVYLKDQIAHQKIDFVPIDPEELKRSKFEKIKNSFATDDFKKEYNNRYTKNNANARNGSRFHANNNYNNNNNNSSSNNNNTNNHGSSTSNASSSFFDKVKQFDNNDDSDNE
jgi:hypothetical protein